MVAGGGGALAWGSPEKKLSTGGPRGMAGAVVAGDGGAVGWGSPEKKLGTGGVLEGWPGQWRTSGGECFRGGRGGAPPATGGGGLLFGRWWLAAQGG